MKECSKRLLLARMKLLSENGFYGLLLMHMKFGMEEGCGTAATDGETIVFDPEFMDSLSENELEFVLMHEVLHVALRHCSRDNGRDHELFNIACDIVVNSNIRHSKGDDDGAISLSKYGVSMHKTPDGKDGCLYTAEEVYDMFPRKYSRGSGSSGNAGPGGQFFDNHSRWGKEQSPMDKARWGSYVRQAAEAVSMRKGGDERGAIPLCAERLLRELNDPRIDWRTVLNDFIQEEVNDYSFCPPDRRFQDGLFLPDFNEKDEKVENVLFMIDASGSMSDDQISECFSEIKGAVDQYDGKLCGKLGFFDADVTPPVDFTGVDDLLAIRPKGGGGTDFSAVFIYIKEHMQEDPPVSIIILTDGYCPFLNEDAALGIPVLWVINNEEMTPPWGKLARI